MTAATPGQAAYEAYHREICDLNDVAEADRKPSRWATMGSTERDGWEGAAQAAREHRITAPHFPPEDAYSPEETAYEALTARHGTSRVAWEALSPEEHADWRAVVRALAKRPAATGETRKMRDVVCKLLHLFDQPDKRLMRHASVTAKTLERYAAEAGVRP